MAQPMLLAVPNVSEGRNAVVIAGIGQAFARDRPPHAVAHERSPRPVRLLDTHSDPDHHRSVFTLAGAPGRLSDALLDGAQAVLATVDLSTRDPNDPASAGRHPHVGALDVVPLVYLHQDARGAACAEALLTAERLGHELAIPVFLYGELTSEREEPAAAPRTRAELRRGGLRALAQRMAGAGTGAGTGEPLRPDFGPPTPHPTAGATLVAARPPLVAFNLRLAPPATLADAKRIAAAIRQDGRRGIRGLRAIGIELTGAIPQVSMNVENPLHTPLASIVEAVRAFAPVESAELVGLAPCAALDGFPKDVPMPGFDPARHVIENRLGSC